MKKEETWMRFHPLTKKMVEMEIRNWLMKESDSEENR